jgi:hypothetical protein
VLRRPHIPSSERAFAAWAVACAAGYLFIQVLYLQRLPLVTDEFDGAYDVYRLRTEIPYVDFAPYKTVAGYYMQLPGLLLGKDVWDGIFHVKYQLAALNAVLTLLGVWLARPLFSRLSLALALPCWLLMSNWLERSSDLRVDLLTTWPAFFSLLVLLRGRPVLAGLLAALSFLVSQKGIYFIVASGPALAAGVWLDTDRRRALRDALRFGLACALPIGAYFALFSLLATAATTTRVMFLSHGSIAFEQIYPNIRKFWRASLEQNPGLYALSALGLGSLAVRIGRDLRHTQLFAYGATLTVLVIWHKQPWPYFFVLIGPTVFLLSASAFEIIGRGQSSRPIMALRWAVLAVPLALALIMPARRMPIILAESQAYQRHMIELTSALLEGGEPYLAAMDLLYDRVQSPKALRRLSIGMRRSLEKAPRKNIDKIIGELESNPPKVLIRNERFNGMPPRVRRFLQDHYAHFWGNLELPAPRIAPRRPARVLFDGRYRVALDDKEGSITLAGRTLGHGDVIELEKGEHAIESAVRGRLHWLPPDGVTSKLDKRFKRPGELIGNAYNR